MSEKNWEGAICRGAIKGTYAVGCLPDLITHYCSIGSFVPCQFLGPQLAMSDSTPDNLFIISLAHIVAHTSVVISGFDSHILHLPGFVEIRNVDLQPGSRRHWCRLQFPTRN